MIAVAVLAILLWGGILATRSIYYGFVAEMLAEKHRLILSDTLVLERRAAKGLTAKEAKLATYGRQMVVYLANQRARYERAARYPWLPVEPDPPLPPDPLQGP
jgi:hypothetical protein